jgi:nicotinic acid mononucleotide adenylyltransferase
MLLSQTFYRMVLAYCCTIKIALFVMLTPIHALYLENIDINSLQNTRVAYYPGSFDPLHLGHTTVVNTVLFNDLADFVLIYALPDSDKSKSRSPFSIRFMMLERLYKDHPKVLITALSPAEMQELLMPHFNDIKFSVVQGSDVIMQYINNNEYDDLWMQGISIKRNKPEHSNTSLGAIMAIPAKRVIAFNRDKEDLSFIGKTYKNRPIIILTAPSQTDLSSTKARHTIKDGQNLSGMVPPEVLEIIQKNKLYQK